MYNLQSLVKLAYQNAYDDYVDSVKIALKHRGIDGLVTKSDSLFKTIGQGVVGTTAGIGIATLAARRSAKKLLKSKSAMGAAAAAAAKVIKKAV